MHIKSDKDSLLTLWDIGGEDKRFDCPPEMEDALIQQGYDPYDLEEMSKLFNCSVTRTYQWQETYRKE